MNRALAKVFLVDDDHLVRTALQRSLNVAGYEVAAFATAREFLDTVCPEEPGCLLLDVAMPAISGLEVQQSLSGTAGDRPIVFLSGQFDVRMSVEAMKAGAIDFLTKPVEQQTLLAAVAKAIHVDLQVRRERATRENVQQRLDLLTRREKEVFDLVVHGRLNKQIAADLGTVEKTVKVHRARVMQKMRVRTLADLVLAAFIAGVARCPQIRPPGSG